MATPNPDPTTGRINLFDPETCASPQPVYRRAVKQCPVAHMAVTDGPVVTRYEDVVWCLRHPEIFSSEMSVAIALGTQRPMIPQQIDPPAQTRYRKILDPLFSRKRMNQLAPDVERDANALIDAVIDAGRCEFNSSFAIPLPCNTFLHLMGLPQSDLALFLRLKDGIIRPHTQLDPSKAMDAEAVSALRVSTGQEIYAYFEDAIRHRRANPSDDLMTCFLTAELDEKPLTNEEILDICFLFILAGLDTVTATLGCNIAYLAGNPAQRQLLLDEESRTEGALEELLRWETPVTGVPRIAKQDVTLHGVEIKAGELVTLLLGSANVDDAEFDAADTVDLLRERNRHIAFGAGAHRCLGSHLARMELVVAMQTWHRRIPHYRIQDGETPRYSAGIREVQYLPLSW